MRTHEHDETLNGDLTVENGAFVTLSGTEATAEMIRRRVRVFKGEWFLDLDRGINYRQGVMVKNPNPLVVESEFKAAIAAVSGFIRFLSFEFSISSARRLSVKFKAMFDSGIITFEEVK